ncbi:MAG: hypothetical protein CMG74_06950 [Candidatus Marinimicrobia bacterium]|nr:hypothetical protein [Candidatus Neomarinimicrobiota bacterium]|tara:strand:+ start:1274 stop:2257 length:984 start_codon:yes stop_codon:yes gene_type:complete
MDSITTIKINDKKLGFTLDKNKSTPTIEKITVGGALETELIESCSQIIPGCEIYSINDECIIGLNYDYAMKKIKSFTERPVELKIKSPIVNIDNNNNPKNLTNKVSVEEMEKISKVTTEKAIRDLVKSEIEKKNEYNSDEDQYDSSSTKSLIDFEEDYPRYISIEKYEKLEREIYNLKLEKTNIEISRKDDIKLLEDKLEPFLYINDIILGINSFDLTNKKISGSKQLTNKLNDINKNYSNYILELDEYISKIEYYGLKVGFTDYIEKMNKKIEKYNKYTKIKINYIYYFELVQFICTIITCPLLINLIYRYNVYNENIDHVAPKLD